MTSNVQTQETLENQALLLDWLDQYEAAQAELYKGQILNGTVVQVGDTGVLVDVGAKAEGVVEARDLEQMSDEKRELVVEGAEIRVFVVRPESKEGHPVLSISRATIEEDWDFIAAQEEGDASFETVITGANKGGLIAHIGQLRAFIPASQVTSVRRRHREDDIQHKERLKELVSTTLLVKVLETDRRNNRVILSERAAERERRRDARQELLASLNEGSVVKGTVSSLADFGAFVDLGGADGLVHLSELSWGRVGHPSEIVQAGEELEVYVLRIDTERERIGLSLKRLQPEPWQTFVDTHEVDDDVSVTITKLVPFGAFAQVDGSAVEGLIHISELSEEHVERAEEIVHVGEVRRARILNLDTDRKRLGLTLRLPAGEFEEDDEDEFLDAYDDEPEAEPEAEPVAEPVAEVEETPEEPTESPALDEPEDEPELVETGQ